MDRSDKMSPGCLCMLFLCWLPLCNHSLREALKSVYINETNILRPRKMSYGSVDFSNVFFVGFTLTFLFNLKKNNHATYVHYKRYC